ncbi:Arm DNA-binding domain-containing protein [Ruegeria sp. HKCCD7255]|uniref:Arm DNA-binding domain-containing protein n=1 Tax=Ruegeria sp. HKCCD7255 TaxID=2683004 RepID=UPI00148797B3
MDDSKNRKLERITEKTLRNLPSPQNGELTYTIAYTRGLTIRVRSTGSKVFYARLWNPHAKKTVRRKLGEWPSMSCSLAIKALDKLKREQEEADWAEPRVHLTMAQAYA